VLVDINWRPVFWDDESQAAGPIKSYVSKADIVKLSDEEAEWLFGIAAADALQHPDKARCLISLQDALLNSYCCFSPITQCRTLPHSNCTLPLAHAQVLDQLPGVKGVLVTGGGAGCSYAFKGAGGKIDYTGVVPVLKVEASDTTGAGDAFLGGFLASLVKVWTDPFAHNLVHSQIRPRGHVAARSEGPN